MNPSTATAALRIGAAALVVVAIVATMSAAQPVVLVNFFGYFTVQGNVLGAVVAVVGAIRLVRGAPRSTAWTVVHWAAATYLAVVGVVYWAVLAPLGAAGGVAVPWANIVLHAVTPVLAILDLLLAPDRARPPVRLLPAVLVYPLVWTVVVLVRGATDGWVPYPFLDPSQGYGVVAAWAALVAGVFTGAAALLRLALHPSPAVHAASGTRPTGSRA